MNETDQQLVSELEELRARLTEAEEALNAIRTREEETPVVHNSDSQAVCTLTGAELDYRLLVEAMNEGALVLSSDGSIVYSNHTFAAMLGLPLEQVIGSTLFEYVAEPDKETLKDLLSNALWTPGRREISFLKENTSHVPAHISVGGLDVEEAGDSISAVVTDLTEHKALECELERYREHLEDLVEERTMQLKETVDQLKTEIEARKKAQVALRESQADLNRAQAVAHTGSWRMKVHENRLLWSDETYRMFGIALGTPLTYELFVSCVHPDDRETVDAIWHAALLGGKYDIEHRIVVGDAVKWVHETAEIELDGHGELLGGFGTVQDITERVELDRDRQEVFEREHRIAEMLQQALMPTSIPEVIDGYIIAARYRPALREAQVGGDFYDVFKLGEAKIGITIGDVVGKGLAAAVRVVAARYAVRSYAFMDMSPALIMTLTNRALLREETNERNVLTAFFAILDLETNTVTYANAGHEPPLVRSSNGQISELGVTGPMLGIVDWDYSENTFALEHGDSIVMFTDGITEARTRDCVLFEQEGVIAHLTRAADASPDQIAEAVLQAATLHAEGNLQDDVAIVVLGYKENEPLAIR